MATAFNVLRKPGIYSFSSGLAMASNVAFASDKHPDVSTRLGSSIRLIFFMRSAKSLGLHDPELDRMFDFKKRFDKVTAFMFILILGAIVLLHILGQVA